MALTVDLDGALERGEFFLLYQPVMELASGRMVGVEALLRWRHPSRGVVAPLDFIPAAEASGLIVPIGQWVLETACAQLARWDLVVPSDTAAPGLAMNVNVAARQVAERAFVDDVARVLVAQEIEPSRLVLEFTESALMRDTDTTMATLHRLKALGVTLAIDDFGTGYSSLSYLRQFPVDVIKIDRSFVANLSKGPGEQALMDSILRLSETLDLQTVAEGIEDDAQLDDLRRLGAALGQGYLFARPIEAEAIAAMLAGGDMESATRDVA
jgi:EAL domain-containing protein (putative c-di-GMP-specific phosphodiesterase class I)